MKIGKSIVFEVDNQKMRLKHSKSSEFNSNMGHIRGKNNSKCLNWFVVDKLLQKSPNATLAKLITNTTAKFHSGLQCSSYFMVKL